MPGPAITFVAPPVQYTDPLASWPSPYHRRPVEDYRCMDGGIAWAVNGGGGAVQVDAAGGNTVNALSQICALWVDNLACNTDVQFVFSDSGHVLTVPGKSAGLYPVNTVRTSFVINAVSPTLPGDITRFAIYNFLPPPVAIAETNFIVSTIVSGVVIAASSTVVVAATQSGILEGYEIAVSNLLAGAGAMNAVVSLQDGAGATLGLGAFGLAAAAAVPALILTRGDQPQRFTSGINLVITYAGVALALGVAAATVRVR